MEKVLRMVINIGKNRNEYLNIMGLMYTNILKHQLNVSQTHYFNDDILYIKQILESRNVCTDNNTIEVAVMNQLLHDDYKLKFHFPVKMCS